MLVLVKFALGRKAADFVFLQALEAFSRTSELQTDSLLTKITWLPRPTTQRAGHQKALHLPKGIPPDFWWPFCPRQRYIPPEAAIRCAVTQPFAGESNEAMTEPMSSGKPARPSAVCEAMNVLTR